MTGLVQFDGETGVDFLLRQSQAYMISSYRDLILEEASRAVTAFKNDYVDIEGSWALSRAVAVIDALKSEV